MNIHRYQCQEETAKSKSKKRKKRGKYFDRFVYAISEPQKGHHNQKRKSMSIFAEKNRSRINKFTIYMKCHANSKVK